MSSRHATRIATGLCVLAFACTPHSLAPSKPAQDSSAVTRPVSSVTPVRHPPIDPNPHSDDPDVYGNPGASIVRAAQPNRSQAEPRTCFAPSKPVVRRENLLRPPVYWNIGFTNRCTHQVHVLVSLTIYEDGKRVAWGRAQRTYSTPEQGAFSFGWLCHAAVGCGTDAIIGSDYRGRLSVQESWTLCGSDLTCGYPPYPPAPPHSSATSGPPCFRGTNPSVRREHQLNPPVHWNVGFSNSCTDQVDVFVSVSIYENGTTVAQGRARRRYSTPDQGAFSSGWLCHAAVGCGKDAVSDSDYRNHLTIQEFWTACPVEGTNCTYPPYPP